MTPILLSLAASAHRPIFSEGNYGSPGAAYFVEDTDVSIALYHSVTCQAPQLWMEVEVDPERPIYVQLGVPQIDRLSDYRPSIALIAPGLPEADLPFDVPDGLGAMVLDSDAVIYDFYEPFTQSDSWVLIEETVTLPEAGTGYIVAWDPGEMTGKLWVAVGTEEVFSADDFDEFGVWLEEVHTFHEIGNYELSEPVTEQSCAVMLDEEGSATAPTGCAAAAAPPALWLVIAGALGLRRQR